MQGIKRCSHLLRRWRPLKVSFAQNFRMVLSCRKESITLLDSPRVYANPYVKTDVIATNSNPKKPSLKSRQVFWSHKCTCGPGMMWEHLLWTKRTFASFASRHPSNNRPELEIQTVLQWICTLGPLGLLSSAADSHSARASRSNLPKTLLNRLGRYHVLPDGRRQTSAEESRGNDNLPGHSAQTIVFEMSTHYPCRLVIINVNHHQQSASCVNHG